MNITRQRNYIYLISILTLAAFLVLKVQRGFTATDEQGGIWNIIQLLFVCCGLYSCFKLKANETQFTLIKRYKLLMFTIWVMSTPYFLNLQTFGFGDIFHFMVIPYGFMVFILFYAIGLHNDIRKYPYILYTSFIITFYLLFSAMRNFYIFLDDKGAVADVYYVVGLLPIIFIYTPQKLRLAPFLIACVAVMMTAKRTGFLALGTIFISYFLFNESDNRKSVFLRIFTLITLMAAVYLVLTKLTGFFNLNMFDRLAKLEEDGGAGRANLWSKLWNSMFMDDRLLPLLVGHGYGSTYKLLHIHAHNDFLEFLYNYGIVIFFIYISIYISMIQEYRRMYKAKFIYAREFLVAIIVSLFLAMFSFYMIDCTHITCCSVCLGLILAEWYKFKNGTMHKDTNLLS